MSHTPTSLWRTHWQSHWQHRRQGSDDAALISLREALPLPLADDEQDLEAHSLLLDAFVTQALPKLGLEVVLATLEEQVQRYGLPDSASDLQALVQQCQLSGEVSTAASAQLQLLALVPPGEPADPELLGKLAGSLALSGERTSALSIVERLLQQPGADRQTLAKGHDLAALLHYQQGDRQGCFRHLFEAVALGSQDPVSLQFLCRLQCEQGAYDAAAASLEAIHAQCIEALQLREQRLACCLNLACGCSEPGTLEAICAGIGGGLYEEGAEILAVAPALLSCAEEAVMLRDAMLRNRLRQNLNSQQKPENSRKTVVKAAAAKQPVRRLGLMAPGFGSGSIGNLAWRLVPWLEQQGFTMVGFRTLAEIEPCTNGSNAEIHSLAGLKASAAAELMREQKLDALIDLCGWQDGQRQDLLRRRVAPLQLGWYSHEISTCLSELDYLLVDRFQAPLEREALTEGLLVLPGSFLAFDQPMAATKLRADSAGALVVTASSAHLSKACVHLWAELLQEQPDRQLWFLHTTYQQDQVWRRLSNCFADAGIVAERLIREPATAGGCPAALLLDPWPWGNWISAMSALEQGVPVVTKQGSLLHQRRTAGVLQLLGLDSFIAEDGGSYLAIASSLLADPTLQQHLHNVIPQQLTNSLLWQPGQLAADLRLALDEVKPG